MLSENLLRDPDGQFQRDYNRVSFAFPHELSGNPVFGLDRLSDYIRRLPENDPTFAYWSNGKVDVSDSWDGSGGERRTLRQTIDDIANNNSLIILKRVELDPEYGPPLRAIMERLIELSGAAMRDDVLIGRGTLLIASPRRITSYHIDADTNFLLQLAGDKSISVFDQTDRTLLSVEELERFYAGDLSGATFKQSRANDGQTYPLDAGRGVHIPSMAPHWARNGSSISVALSVNFDLRSIQQLARIYKMNHRLRRYGIKPTPPGVSTWRDGVKLASAKGLVAARGLLRR